MFFPSRPWPLRLCGLGMDNIIEAKELQIERKHFHVEFRENDRGKFLRITEEAHGRRNTIIVPSTGVEEFTAAIGEGLAGAENALRYSRKLKAPPSKHFSQRGGRKTRQTSNSDRTLWSCAID